MDEVDSVVGGKSISTEGNINQTVEARELSAKFEKRGAHFVCKAEHLGAPRVERSK